MTKRVRGNKNVIEEFVTVVLLFASLICAFVAAYLWG